MNKPVWVVFDVGDVLLNWQKSATMLSLKFGTERDELLTSLFRYADDMLVGKISATEGWSRVVNDLNIEAAPEDLLRTWRSKDSWFEEPLNLIEQLDAAGYKLAIMANSWLEINTAISSEELPSQTKLFSHVFESYSLTIKKPSKSFYRHVEQALHATGDEILLVDDGLANITVAASLGWQTFHFVAEHASAKKATASLKVLLIS